MTLYGYNNKNAKAKAFGIGIRVLLYKFNRRQSCREIAVPLFYGIND